MASTCVILIVCWSATLAWFTPSAATTILASRVVCSRTGARFMYSITQVRNLHFYCKPCTYFHIFDFGRLVASPTPPDGVSFHRTGIAAVGHDTEQLKSFDTLVQDLGHANNTIIDILKIDVEGAEFDVFLDGATLRTMRKTVRQILVEVHYKVEEKAVALARAFTDTGFYVYSKEPNIQYSNGDCVEFGLLNVHLV